MKTVKSSNIYRQGDIPSNRAFMLSGEKRTPRKGEWYLSGAIPEAYQAPNDISQVYHLLKEVKVTKEYKVSEIE